MISVRKVNNIKVKPIKPIKPKDTRPFKGRDLFEDPYANVFICARKKSGKTSVTGTIMKKCIGKNTRVIIFCTTVDIDDSWVALQAWCEERDIPIETHTSIKEDNIDLVDLFIKRMELKHKRLKDREDRENGKVKDDNDRGDPSAPISSLFGQSTVCRDDSFDIDNPDDYDNPDDLFLDEEPDDDSKDNEPKRKSKYLTPDFIFIFDDMSKYNRASSVDALLKKNRHFKMLTIVSSQYVKDLRPEALQQINVFILFKSQPVEGLQLICDISQITVDFPSLLRLYDFATKDDPHRRHSHNFLLISRDDNVYKKNFNQLLNIK